MAVTTEVIDIRLVDADHLVFLVNDATILGDGFKQAFTAIVNGEPTINPVKKGKWIIYTLSMFDGEDCKCSECGQISCAPYWNFCPNCGSRMEGCEQE